MITNIIRCVWEETTAADVASGLVVEADASGSADVFDMLVQTRSSGLYVSSFTAGAVSHFMEPV